MSTIKRPRYLIGSGEKLTHEEKFVSSPKPPKQWPYSVAEAAKRLKPKLDRTINAIPVSSQALPRGEAVALISLHPESLAKSWFPAALFASVGLRTIGCRARMIRPEKWSSERDERKPKTVETIELYMAGQRSNFLNWADSLDRWSQSVQGGDELVRIEDVRPLYDLDQPSRIKIGSDSGNVLLLEAALHADARAAFDVAREFSRYAKSLNVEVMEDATVSVPGVTFVPIRASRNSIENLAKFSFLRSIRPVAKIRALPPESLTRSLGSPFMISRTAPLNPAIRVAVLDGGLSANHGLPAVQLHNTPGIGNPHPSYVDHGTAVTAALLWGATPTPSTVSYASVDHFRVLDVDDARRSDVHAYRVLRRIQDVIETGSHDIFNLSLGPDVCVDDDEVHPWTSTLDSCCADGSRLLVVAAGNNGERPKPLYRIQAPSDGVNCLSVGAADSCERVWKRADYSAMGPGRRPGITKPEVVAFGGDHKNPFKTIRQRGTGYTLIDDMGTSFSAPLVARAAAALRSYFSSNLHPLTLKGLLIHCAHDGGNPVEEVGWGRLANESELIQCPDATARIIYQGDLPPRKLLRARIPIPQNLAGLVRVTATVCYSTEISASDPLNYTNSGIEITYRPHANKRDINKQTGKPSTHAKPATFFKKSDYASEEERRTRDRKWETIIHTSKRVDAGKVFNPVFDLHFIPRIGAADHPNPERIRYSMVITVASPKYPDLYERVLAAFPELQALTPVVIPLSAT